MYLDLTTSMTILLEDNQNISTLCDKHLIQLTGNGLYDEGAVQLDWIHRSIFDLDIDLANEDLHAIAEKYTIKWRRGDTFVYFDMYLC